MRVPNFVGGHNPGQSRTAQADLCINVFPEVFEEEGGKSRGAFWSAPGVVEFAQMPDSPGRGIYCENGKLFGVGGTTLCEIAQDGSVTNRGAVPVSADPVTFESLPDGSELFVISGTTGLILDLQTNVLTAEVHDVTQGGEVDGFLLGLDGNSSTLKISEPLNGKTWDPSQIAQRSAASDPWKSMIVAGREIYLLGERTGEVWYNAGRSPFPFAQRNGAFFETGIAAPFSLARFGATFAWLGKDANDLGAVYWMNGYSPNEISTPAIRWVIGQIAEAFGISDAIGWSYAREKHRFYVLTFPNARHTLVYDALTSKWHQRGKWSPRDNAFLAYRPMFHTEAFGKNLVCDSATGKIYAFSSTVYRDVDGDEIRRVRRFRHPGNENKTLFFLSAELECERGVGLTNPVEQGHDPEVILRYSNDGGHSFGADRPRKVGKKGKANTRVRWDMCGSGRDRVWELVSTDPVATRWFDFYVEQQKGRH